VSRLDEMQNVIFGSSCERCGRTVFLVECRGTTIQVESIDDALRVDGRTAAPVMNVYVPHATRCPGELGAAS